MCNSIKWFYILRGMFFCVCLYPFRFWQNHMVVQFGYMDFRLRKHIKQFYYISILDIENVNTNKYIDHLKRNWVREFADRLTFI